jgi:hypothetical protein
MGFKIISLSGEAEVGKDCFALPLIIRGWKKGSFAEPLKEMCMDIFEVSYYYVNKPEGKKKQFDRPRIFTEQAFAKIIGHITKTYDIDDKIDIITQLRETYIKKPLKETGKYLEFNSSRQLLQFVGTDICRAVFPEYFLDMLKLNMNNDPRNTVVTDARFYNERMMLKEEFGAKLIRIKRPGYTPINMYNRTVSTDITKSHVSENSLGYDEEYDLIILNDGTKAELQDKISLVL